MSTVENPGHHNASVVVSTRFITWQKCCSAKRLISMGQMRSVGQLCFKFLIAASLPSLTGQCRLSLREDEFMENKCLIALTAAFTEQMD